MQIRCPHCHHAVEIVGNEEFASINCPSCGSAFDLVPETASYTPDTRTIAHFELLDQLGAGGFGTVWKARDKKLDRLVAVKIPRRDQINPADAEMFFREARAAAQLRHQHIVAVHEVGREDGTLYIVSDFIQGVTLADRLAVGPFSPREAAALVATIADALHHAHEAGVIHRDLKPQNIMLDGDDQPKLMDFGLAKREAGEVTMTIDGKILGTPAYMSPEQARGEGHGVDRRTDIYSLGVILFELLTGERPFRGNQRMLLHQVINDEPLSPLKLNSRIPRDLETICLKCLEKNPARRYATSQEVGEELKRFLKLKPILARPVTKLERAWRWCRRHPAVALLGTAAAIGAIGFLVSAAAVALGSGFASMQFERAWVAQIVDDNAAIASAIAEAAKERFSDRMQVVEKEGMRWRELFDKRAGDDPAFQERIRHEIQETYRANRNKISGWHLTDSNGRMLVNYGDSARTGEPRFEDAVIPRQYGWRGWFNGKKDLASEFRTRDFSEAAAYNALIERPSDLFLSAPYKRRVDGVWVIAISRRITPSAGGPPVAVLCGQIPLQEFTHFIAAFDLSQMSPPRKIAIANDIGQALHHTTLTTRADDSFEDMNEPIDRDDAPEPMNYSPLQLESLANQCNPTAHSDPWEPSDMRYFIGCKHVQLASSQRLSVLVLLDEERALRGLRLLRIAIFVLGVCVFITACAVAVLVAWGLRHATRLEALPGET